MGIRSERHSPVAFKEEQGIHPTRDASNTTATRVAGKRIQSESGIDATHCVNEEHDKSLLRWTARDNK